MSRFSPFRYPRLQVLRVDVFAGGKGKPFLFAVLQCVLSRVYLRLRIMRRVLQRDGGGKVKTEKQLTWIHGNKARIETAHKGFNRYCVSLCPGNVIGGGQQSSFIRPYAEVECNGRKFPAGELRAFDLAQFDNLPQHVESAVKQQTESVILYRLYSDGVTHGYILAAGACNGLIRAFPTGPTWKSRAVLEWCAPYLTSGPMPALTAAAAA